MADAVPQIRVTNTQDGEPSQSSTSSAAPAKDVIDKTGRSAVRQPVSSDAARDEAGSLSSSRVSHETPDRHSASVGIPSGHSSRSQLNGDNHSQSNLDPLSEQLFKRTNVSMPGASRASFSQSDSAQATLSRTTTAASGPDFARGDNTSKDKKKGVSFLSRFMNTKKKDVPEKLPELETESRDERPEGMDAELFSQPLDNIGYSPHHRQPPGYIKMRSHNKKEKEFDRLFLAQELRSAQQVLKGRNSLTGSINSSRRARTSNADAVWAMEFSKDGRYLAASGQDKIVRIWAVLSSREERQAHEQAEDASDEANGRHMRLSAPVFQSKPFREFEGHTAAVLDLSWSKNNFLLSSSMDKSVRLWHTTRAECLCTFKHNDLVTSIQFHPRDDRFFLAGCLDSKIRLWSIPDKSVAFWNQVPEMITAVSFTPDGKTAVAGCLSGLCLLYETEGMKYQTQIHVKSTHGKNAKGSKITGIEASTLPPGKNGDTKLLITSNDSRIRLYNLRDKSIEMKFKGNQNASMQIYARFSDDGKYVICGSDDHKAYIWSTTSEDTDKNKRPVEMFEAHQNTTTVARFAPRATRQLLGNSEDPIYDLCNPPPVTLMSKSEVDSLYSAHDKNGTSNAQPPTSNPENTSVPKRPEYSAAYLARSIHKKGNIIVTADSAGVIKVFRQDCACEKRQNADEISLFANRAGTSVIRKSSMATYVTNHSHSTTRSRQNSVTSQPSVDRVLSWRQSIPSSNSSLERTSSNYLAQANSRGQTRSNSPQKTAGVWARSPNNANGNFPRNSSMTSTTGQTNNGPRARQSSSGTTTSSPADSAKPTDSPPLLEEQVPASRELASTTDVRPEAERINSNVYWRRDAWKYGIQDQLQAIQNHRLSDAATGGYTHTYDSSLVPADANSLRPGLPHSATNLSTLSSERGTPSDLSDAGDGPEPPQQLPAGTVCAKCGGTSFKPRPREGLATEIEAAKGKTGLWSCARCGRVREEGK